MLNKSGKSQRSIALLIGSTQPTISRELQRHAGARGYRHKQAHGKAQQRRADAVVPTKLTADNLEIINTLLQIEWSPVQVSGWLRDNGIVSISHVSIYRHIGRDKKLGGYLYQHLRRQGKYYTQKRLGKSTRGRIKNRVCIEQRPQVVDDKARIGDWEIDTVIGKGHSGALVTLVERVTKFTLAAQVPNKTAVAATAATVALLKPYQHVVHTITADNGKEFAHHEQISKALKTAVYFAHPYSSWERGLNENTNGLLRQYFPKSTDLKQVDQSSVQRAVKRLNARPRKLLGFKTPAKLMGDYMATLVA